MSGHVARLIVRASPGRPPLDPGLYDARRVTLRCGHSIARGGSAMRVIGAGFGRTGTLSFKRALEDLGFGPTYHMQEAMRRPSHMDRWLPRAPTGEGDWEALFS